MSGQASQGFIEAIASGGSASAASAQLVIEVLASGGATAGGVSQVVIEVIAARPPSVPSTGKFFFRGVF